MKKIKELMTKSVRVVKPSAPITEAAEMMREIEAGILPVQDNNQIVGVVTDRDIVLRVVAEGRSPAETLVSDVMTNDVVRCYEDQDAREAANLMAEKQVRRLVIFSREGKLSGILSLGDLAAKTHDEKLSGKILEEVSVAGRLAAHKTVGDHHSSKK